MLDENKHFLGLTLQKAQLSEGQCAPNPAVGAIVVRNAAVIASGFHRGPGLPHAEVEALSQLSDAECAGATLYVSLEPCCHHGRTPPCTDLIIQRGIKHVVYAFADPNPQVAGKGAQQLQAAGVSCKHISTPAIDVFYQAYAHWWKTKTPWMIAKLAMSLDGKISGHDGEPLAITGEKVRAFTHAWRGRCDAILTSARTIKKDNPQFTVRASDKVSYKPLVVVDSRLQLEMDARVFEGRPVDCPVICLHSDAASSSDRERLEGAGVRCIDVVSQHGQLDLHAVVKALGALGYHRVWIESGGALFSAFLREKLLQQAFIAVAPKWLGLNAVPAFDDLTQLRDLPKATLEKLGQDALFSWDF